MSDEMDIRVITPPRDDSDLSELLRNLTKMIVDRSPEKHVGGFFGGDYGYGCDIETPVFRMFPYYWGDCTCGFDELCSQWEDSNKHTDRCYQAGYWAIDKAHDWINEKPAHAAAVQALCATHGIPYDDGRASACHCTCGHQQAWEAWIKEHSHSQECPIARPNFLHKPSGAKVDWYKYIGRGMEIEAPEGFDWETCMRECALSLPQER